MTCLRWIVTVAEFRLLGEIYLLIRYPRCVCLTVCLLVCVYVCLSASLSVCLSICLDASLSAVCFSVGMPICVPPCLSVCLSACLIACCFAPFAETLVQVIVVLWRSFLFCRGNNCKCNNIFKEYVFNLPLFTTTLFCCLVLVICCQALLCLVSSGRPLQVTCCSMLREMYVSGTADIDVSRMLDFINFFNIRKQKLYVSWHIMIINDKKLE